MHAQQLSKTNYYVGGTPADAQRVLRPEIQRHVAEFDELQPGDVSIIDLTNETTGERRLLLGIGGVTPDQPELGGEVLFILSNSGQIPQPWDTKSIEVFPAPFGSVVAIRA